MEHIAQRSAEYSSPKEPLHPKIAECLRRQGIERLYSHQSAALDDARAHRNIVVTAGTAGGKTLCYNLPVLERILQQPAARALYLFPTKALAQDQLGKLNDFGLFPEIRFATFDGDTPQQDRKYIKRAAQLVLTNPDMLHMAILPRHTEWAAFLSRLQFLILDELHVYRGVFGMHFAQVMRRLLRLCRHYRSEPQIIASSATIHNPAQHFQRITGCDAALIDNDGSPTGKRTFVLWNPPVINSDGYRRSAHAEASELFLDLTQNDVRSIVFTKARKSAELILRFTRNALESKDPQRADRILSYRAGYTKEQRRQIEQDLFSGRLIGVTATTALELGVDVGGLDATVLTGYPGTLAGTWQQAGRAGRRGKDALNVMVAMDSPLDQYIMRHPQYLFERPVESAVVNPDNPRIVTDHLRCAAYEMPLTAEELRTFGPASAASAQHLQEEGTLLFRNGRWYYRGDPYPASRISLRSMGGSPFTIRAHSPDGPKLGDLDESRVYSAGHPGAVYLHMGETFVVTQLDEPGRTVVVEPREVNYYTEPRDVTQLTVLDHRAETSIGEATARFGQVVVSNQVVGFQKKRLYGDQLLEIVPLELPPVVYPTHALWWEMENDLAVALMQEGYDLGGSIHAVEHAAIGMMPLLNMCDRWDIGGLSTPQHMDTGKVTIFLYDGYPEGAGICEAAFQRLRELLQVTLKAVSECPCLDGCPCCVQSPKCGNNNSPLDKRGAVWLLRRLLHEETTTG